MESYPNLNFSIPSAETKTLDVESQQEETAEEQWVYKLKKGIQGIQEPGYNAKLVVKGYTQRDGIDHNEVFSPVVTPPIGAPSLLYPKRGCQPTKLTNAVAFELTMYVY